MSVTRYGTGFNTGQTVFAVLLLLLALMAVSPAAAAVDASLKWRTLSSDHFNLHYHEGLERLAPRILAMAERVRAELIEEFQWQPRGRVEVVLTDNMDLANGFATPQPFNKVQLYVTPPADLGYFDAFEDWYELLFTHEYTHILHLDKAAGPPGVLRRIFGRHWLTFPNAFQPLWMVEGLAIHKESHEESGSGRGHSHLTAMRMRTEVLNGVKPYDQVSMTGLSVWPGGDTPYLYGQFFFEYLHDTYGPAIIDDLVDGYSRKLVPFLVQTNFRQVLGKRMPAIWADYSRYLQARFEPELEAIRAAGVVAGEQVTRHGYHTGAAAAAADGSLFYVRDDALRPPALMQRSPDGRTRKVTNLLGLARLDWHPQAGLLVAQPEIHRNDNLYYDLYHVDPRRGRTTRLTRGGRYLFAAWHPSGERIAAVQMAAGQSRLVELTANGEPLRTLWQGQSGEILSQLDWAPDGQSIVAAVWRPGTRWNLERYYPGSGRWQRLTDGAGIPSGPRFTADGEHLLFSSDEGGIYNLRRLHLASGRLETLTRVETGAFAPVPAGADGDIFYVGYHGNGYDIYRLAPGPALASRTLPRFADVADPMAPADELAADGAPYSPVASLRPTSWSPLLFADQEVFEAGAETWGQDALGLHHYFAGLSHEFNFGLLSGYLGYQYHHYLSVVGARNHEYRFDEEGALVDIRRVEGLEVSLLAPWLRRERWGALRLGTHWNRERDAHLESGAAGRPPLKDTVVGVGLVFDSTRSAPRAISRNHGRDIRLTAESSDLLANDYSGEIYQGDWREFLPLGGQHVLAARLAAGWGTEEPRPFRLGGAVDGLDSPFQFNRRRYLLRGYPTGLEALTGRRFHLGSAEYRFPLLSLDRALRTPPVGLNRVSGRLFVDHGAAWDEGRSPEEYLTGVGAEVITDSTLFYMMRLRLRLGYARGLDDGGEDQFYLTVGSAF